MDIQTALQAFEQGHMTKYEAASLMVHLIQAMPDVAPRYAAQINALIQAKYIQQRNGIYFARRPGGRPRNKKPAIQTTLRIDPETLAAIDAHPLARFMSRNDLILFLLQGALKIQH
jgi:hypothetical protein